MSGAPNAVRVLRAAVVYFAIVFAAGFVLGTVRTLFLAPRMGVLGAVLVEVPFMLAVAFVTCRWVLAHYRIGPPLAGRFAIGGLAFLLLVGAELLLAVAGFGSTVAEFFLAYATPAGMLGLAAQLAFAAMPMLVRADTGR